MTNPKPVDDAIDTLVRSLLKEANRAETKLPDRIEILANAMKWVAIKHKVDGTDTGEGSAINGYTKDLDTGTRAGKPGSSPGARLSKATDATAGRILRDAKRGHAGSGQRTDDGHIQGHGDGAGGEGTFAVGRAERIPPIGLGGNGSGDPAAETDHGGGV